MVTHTSGYTACLAWDPTATYAIGSVVSYGGACWVCYAAVGPVATTPIADATHWKLKAGANSVPVWSAAATYPAGSLVYVASAVAPSQGCFQAVAAVGPAAIDPTADTTNWVMQGSSVPVPDDLVDVACRQAAANWQARKDPAGMSASVSGASSARAERKGNLLPDVADAMADYKRMES
jgi:hypothetical protein